ncbi:asparaginase [Streptomyces sp. NPDC005423]|uniref:asparaginase n=1 Tax=Streptomyces sp. NPDC005423 TaxID=3155343 RepID=UPI0033B0D7F2
MAAAHDRGRDLTGERLTLATASHWGEPLHPAPVRTVLDEHGLPAGQLECPPAGPAPRSGGGGPVPGGGRNRTIPRQPPHKGSPDGPCRAAWWAWPGAGGRPDGAERQPRGAAPMLVVVTAPGRRRATSPGRTAPRDAVVACGAPPLTWEQAHDTPVQPTAQGGRRRDRGGGAGGSGRGRERRGAAVRRPGPPRRHRPALPVVFRGRRP